jgi:hypothetical protein
VQLFGSGCRWIHVRFQIMFTEQTIQVM